MPSLCFSMVSAKMAPHFAAELGRRRNPRLPSCTQDKCNEIEEQAMAATVTSPKSESTEKPFTRKDLIALLNEDLAREYQAVIAYVTYSQVLKGAQYMNIAAELAVHATEELQHAVTLANQIDNMGGMPT